MGGIVETAEMQARGAKLATVVAMGPGKLIADQDRFVPPRLAVGDLVYFNMHAGTPIGLPGEFDFVVLGAGQCADSEDSKGTRCRYNPGTKEALPEENGPDLMLDRTAILQLQTEDAVYMKVV